MNVSVVIPSRAGESAWMPLLRQLCSELPRSQIILSLAQAPNREYDDALGATREFHEVDVVVGSPGRAAQLNRGAAIARGEVIWFLHADSRLTPSTWPRLSSALVSRPTAVHFSRLQFHDGGALMKLTAVGANFRSCRLGLPFGDQGLCLERRVFEALGGYDESAPYGEDHLLVWQARRSGVAVVCTGGTLATSAAKYVTNGWGRVTFDHFVRTWAQAFREMFRIGGLTGGPVRKA